VQSRPSGESEESEADFIHVLLSIQQEYGLTTDNLKAILVVSPGVQLLFLLLYQLPFYHQTTVIIIPLFIY
jgi:hypothetical protein